jgi:DNA-directed RNA polymerase alpha subunit
MPRLINPKLIVHVSPEDPSDRIISLYVKDYKDYADDQYRKGFTDCFRALRDLDLRVFHLSDKTIGALRRNGIVNISQLIALSRDQIKSLDGIGTKRFQEIEDILDEFEDE